MNRTNPIEALLWSIALPGFGQLLNGKYIKGLLLIALEVLINVQSNLNTVIISSFHGDIERAISQADYQWIMFYPCVYMFGIWDAYKDASGDWTRFGALPFVFGAYFGTIGVVYSPVLQIRGTLIGPIWLGLSGFLIGVGVGIIFSALFRSGKSGRNT